MLHLVARSRPTLCDPMDCSLPGSSVPGILQTRILRFCFCFCHAPLQEIFPTQGLNPGLLNCRQILYRLSHQRSPFNSSVQFSSVAQSCLSLCDPMNRSMPGLPVHHQLPEFTQTPVHRVSDAIQPSHPWLFPSSPAPNPSQHQSLPVSQLFISGGQSIGASASVLPMNIQD